MHQEWRNWLCWFFPTRRYVLLNGWHSIAGWRVTVVVVIGRRAACCQHCLTSVHVCWRALESASCHENFIVLLSSFCSVLRPIKMAENIVIKELLWEGADKSLARPTSRCRRTESIASLERGVCSCAELQVFSCYRGWKEVYHATRPVIKFFSCKARHRSKFTPFWQKH